MAQSPLYYGGCVISDNTQTTIVTGNTYVKAANTTRAIGCYGFTHSNNRLTYTGNTGRMIEVTATLSMQTSAATQVFFTIFKNGVVIDADAAIQRAVGVGSDTGAGGCSILCSMVKDDYVEIWVTTDDGDEVTLTGGTMIAKVVG